MIKTLKGNSIEINGHTEWLLFHRLTKKTNPIEFLSLTDNFIQLPNFLFTFSALIMLFIQTDLWLNFFIPSLFYFYGQVVVNLKLGTADFKLLQYPLQLFSSINIFIMLAVFICSCIYLSWWAILYIPTYLTVLILSVSLLLRNERKFYLLNYHKKLPVYEIFKKNAFLLTYHVLAKKYNLIENISPTEQEIDDEDWVKPLSYMKRNWEEMEKSFNENGRRYWLSFLNLEK